MTSFDEKNLANFQKKRKSNFLMAKLLGAVKNPSNFSTSFRMGKKLIYVFKPEIPLKFIYSEKATKFCKISTLLLTGTT